MEISGFNRVELIVREDQIEDAVRQFNELLGTHLPHPHPIEGQPVLSSTDFDGFVEFVAPIDGEEGFGAKLAAHGPGQIGPLVGEIAGVDEARAWLVERGFRIGFEYDSSKGNASKSHPRCTSSYSTPSNGSGSLSR